MISQVLIQHGQPLIVDYRATRVANCRTPEVLVFEESSLQRTACEASIA